MYDHSKYPYPLLFCSEIHAVCDDSDEYLNEQEEEHRHMVQLEAEERKLEETLKYQRRIEEEAKQKHLAEQFRSTYASSVIGAAARPKTVNLIRAQDNHERAPNNSSTPYLEGIKFGDFRFSEGSLREDHSSPGLFDMNQLQNSDNILRGKQNGWNSPGTGTLNSNDMGISKLTLNMNGVWKSAHPIKSKKGTSEPQKKYAQGCWLCVAQVRPFTINSLYNIKFHICLLLQLCPVLFMMMIEHLVHTLVCQLLDGALQVK